MCRQAGVQRVFVEHPLFANSDIYGGGGAFTYLEAGERPELELRYSVLCQAALAAPVLLEQAQQGAAGSSGSGDVDMRDAEEGQQAEQQQQQRQPIVYVANDWPTALLLLRLQYSIRAAARAAGAASAGALPPAATTAAAAGSEGVASAAELQQLLAQRLGASAAAAYCIHNLAYQGVLSAESFPRLCLPPAAMPALCTSHDWREVLQQLEGMLGQGSSSSGGASAAASEQHSPRPGCSGLVGEGEESSPASTLHPPSNEDAAPGAASPAATAAAAAGGACRAATGSEETAAGAQASDVLSSCISNELNQMRAALLAADALVTVSRGYAAEVQQEGPFGCGFHEILAARGISGIMNGIDTAEWDPATDPHLPEAGRYTASGVGAGKARMKAWLQERLGLEVDPSVPLIGFVGRLTQQKGVDVLLAAAPALLAGAAQPPAPSRWRPESLEAAASLDAPRAAAAAGAEFAAEAEQQADEEGLADRAAAAAAGAHGASAGGSTSSGRSQRGSSGRPAALGGGGLPAAPPLHPWARVVGGVSNAPRSSHLEVSAEPAAQAGVQLVLLGTGEPWMEAALGGLAQSFPRQAAGLTTFSEELAHWIVAACDFVLVPSRFEPCGLVAQAGARYGAVPIVCAVGGLKDFVTPEVGYLLPAFRLDGTAADHRQNVQQLLQVVRQAAAEYGGEQYQRMQQRCMALDVSWEAPAAEWEELLTHVAADVLAARCPAAD